MRMNKKMRDLFEKSKEKRLAVVLCKDWVPMNISDGCFSSYSLLADMTGIVLQEKSDGIYRGQKTMGSTDINRLPLKRA